MRIFCFKDDSILNTVPVPCFFSLNLSWSLTLFFLMTAKCSRSWMLLNLLSQSPSEHLRCSQFLQLHAMLWQTSLYIPLHAYMPFLLQIKSLEVGLLDLRIACFQFDRYCKVDLLRDWTNFSSYSCILTPTGGKKKYETTMLS